MWSLFDFIYAKIDLDLSCGLIITFEYVLPLSYDSSMSRSIHAFETIVISVTRGFIERFTICVTIRFMNCSFIFMSQVVKGKGERVEIKHEFNKGGVQK